LPALHCSKHSWYALAEGASSRNVTFRSPRNGTTPITGPIRESTSSVPSGLYRFSNFATAVRNWFCTVLLVANTLSDEPVTVMVIHRSVPSEVPQGLASVQAEAVVEPTGELEPLGHLLHDALPAVDLNESAGQGWHDAVDGPV